MIFRPVRPASPWPADFEPAGGVHVDDNVVVPPVIQHRLKNVLGHLLLERALLFVPGAVVLGGKHDRMDAHRPTALVFHRHLRLGVRPQSSDQPFAPRVDLLLHDAMRQVNRQRHQLRRLPTGEAEHHALIARPIAIHAHGDVRRLPFDRCQDAARFVVERHVAGDVADFADGLADDVGDLDISLRGDFAGHDHHAGRDEGFAGDTRVFVLLQHGVENGVRNLVGHLIRVTHADGLRRKQIAFGLSGLRRQAGLLRVGRNSAELPVLRYVIEPRPPTQLGLLANGLPKR